MNPSVSVKNRSLRDSSRMRTRTRTRNGSMDACLSFTTVSIFTDTDTYTDHNSRTYGWLALPAKNIGGLVGQSDCAIL